jgi:NAD(P)-dependent dehydrogenase (short-subunit alcohol dehydrogenase family)
VETFWLDTVAPISLLSRSRTLLRDKHGTKRRGGLGWTVAYDRAAMTPVVLITGATGPLGRAAADRFAGDGARVAVMGRDQGKLDELRASVDVDDDHWLAVTGELDDRDAARAVATSVTQRWQRIDVLLHLVGGWAGGTPVVELDPAELRTLLDQHLWTTLHVTQAVVPGMIERGFGRVLAVSSPFATDVRTGGASYAIAKAAEEVLLRTLAREAAGTGVTANLVLVRTIDTRHERETEPSPRNASWTTPEEIAATLAFLASPAAAAINGVRIPLDGRAHVG